MKLAYPKPKPPLNLRGSGFEKPQLIKSFGRYYGKSEGGERQAMLSAYDARPRTMNRQSFKHDADGDGSSQKLIDYFYVCMGGGVQPDAADFL